MMSGRRLISTSYSLFHFYYSKNGSIFNSFNSVSTHKQVWAKIITAYTMENKIKVDSAIMELTVELRKTNITQ